MLSKEYTERVKKLVEEGKFVFSSSGEEDIYFKHPLLKPEETVKKCFRCGIIREGSAVFPNEKEYQKYNHCLARLRERLKLFSAFHYTIVSFFVKDDVVIVHIAPMNSKTVVYFKKEIKNLKNLPEEKF